MALRTELTDYMGFQGLLTDEEKLVRETARKFVNAEVLPRRCTANGACAPRSLPN